MATSALAYHTFLNNINQWTHADINHVMNTGHLYYLKCLHTMHHEHRIGGYLDPTQLTDQLEIDGKIVWVHPAHFACGDGMANEDYFIPTMDKFEKCDQHSAILTCASLSYGLQKIRNTENDAWKFVFFDSHGRDNRGLKVHPVIDGPNNGKAAILFFDTAQMFINFFLGHYSKKSTFSLVPITFQLQTSVELRNIQSRNDLNYEVLPTVSFT